MKTLLFILAYGLTCVSAQSLSFSVSSSTGNYSLNCVTNQLTLTASSNYSAPVNYAWTSASFSGTGSIALINAGGIYTVSAMSGTASATQTLSIVVNTVIPISSASSTFQVVSGTNSPQSFTFTAVSPSVNITHFVYTPTGGTVTFGGTTMIYLPGTLGNYMHCIVNNVNGCTSCHPFAVSVGAPGTYTTGLKENELEKDRVFPNPSNGLYTLELQSETHGTIEVYNSIGVLVKNHNAEKDGKVLDIREEPNGIYVIKMHDGEGRARYLKLIKE